MTKKFKLSPYPVVLFISNDASKFQAENVVDLIGYANYNGTTIYMTINPANDVMTQLDTCVHEAVHVVQYVEDIVETKLDKETEAYLVQHVVKLARDICKLKAKI